MTSGEHENEYMQETAAEGRTPAENLRSHFVPAVSELFAALPSKRQDLTFVMLKSCYLAKGMSVNEPEFSSSLGLMTADGRYNQLAYVLADSNSVFMDISEYSGADMTLLASCKQYGEKSLLFSMGEAEKYAGSFNESYADMSKAVRADMPLYNADAFRAAWHNACLHNSWYTMVPPHIDVYDDRMEIVSAGGLPEGMTEDEFFAGASRPVNPELHKIMTQLGYVQPAEHGVQCITAAYGRNAFRISDNSVTVVIPFGFRRSGNLIGGPVSDDRTRQVRLQRKILEQIKANPRITISQIASSCKAGTATITNYLSRMAKDGLIAREGSRKTGSWKVL
ncbi:MAG: winged helix-turn-helix transcriptional regulator [Clostridia bacterium]|nr:winged helix-turn-helix transcriptional regulator [Clostridia bacterium]